MERIEDYALIGDMHSAALVSRTGSIDWLCWPRFDSDACFSALLGSADCGKWSIAPEQPVLATTRRYRPGTMVLETNFEVASGVARVIDCMPDRVSTPRVVRLVQGLEGSVTLASQLCARFGYGASTPRIERKDGQVFLIAGPDALVVRTRVEQRVEHADVCASFCLNKGECLAFELVWFPSWQDPPAEVDAVRVVSETAQTWQDWSRRAAVQGPYVPEMQRSLLTLKCLTYAPTGAVIAAPTTSLPEQLHGGRNWDYRYCWLRDATLTLLALMDSGYCAEAAAFKNWLLRAVAAEPKEMQVMYGLGGERRIVETELPWLSGYEGARPVRVGNGAVSQFQLDTYGQLIDCLHQARKKRALAGSDRAWSLQCALLQNVADHWRDPDKGIWELRGPPRQFTHSKIMAWVAVDRMIKTAEHSTLDAPLERWRKLREDIHSEVCRKAYDSERNCFVQEFGGKAPDASLLLIPTVGFLPGTDGRVVGTIRAVERELMEDGLLYRYDSRVLNDHLPAGEGTFVACSFWLVNAYLASGRREDAERLFDRLVGLCNDVGLLAEEYDVHARRFVGNFPQAFSHLGLVDAGLNLYGNHGRLSERSE